jgi:hypothetical protein
MSDGGPDWVREAAAAVRGESVRFVRTAVYFSVHPRRFATAWYDGTTEALNPVGFLSTSLAISTAVVTVSAWLLDRKDDGGFWSNLGDATLPYIYYVLLGILSHVVLRLCGSTRPLRASVAIALFAGGGPGLVLRFILYCQVWIHIALVGSFHGQLLPGLPGWYVPISQVLFYGSAAYFLLALAAGLRGLHAVSRGRTAGALVVALVSSGLALGVLHDVIVFSFNVPHFVIRFGHDVPFLDVWF